MQIQISIKQLGKKRPALGAKSINIGLLEGMAYALHDVLREVMTQQVEEFNQKREENNLFTYFKKDALEQAASIGRVSFGEIYNNEKADLNKAIDTIFLAFEDGLIAVFVDDVQLESLEQTIRLTSESTVTFIRLTFLAGSIW